MRRSSPALVVLLALAACHSRSVDLSSKGVKEESLKVKLLDEYAMGPTTPLEAEFHIVYRDNSSGLVPGSDDYDITAAVKVPPEVVPRWADGCERARLEARPQWTKDLVGDAKEWRGSEAPDTFRCGHEERIVHVKEGIIFRHLVSR